jgi:hypothetical protein
MYGGKRLDNFGKSAIFALEARVCDVPELAFNARTLFDLRKDECIGRRNCGLHLLGISQCWKC